MKKLKIGIAGLGTVGASLVQLLCNKTEITIAGVCAKNKNKKRDAKIKKIKWFASPVELAKSDIDVFVELIGGEDGAALQSVTAALNSGKHVVTANKALLAKHGFQLATLAEKNGLAICYEAAVAGCVPIIRTMQQSLSGDNISKVLGILNGTCNYILTRMENESLPFQKVLAEAQRLGYAEANPTFDIDGFDSAHKIIILARLAFGEKIEKQHLSVKGIRAITLEDIKAAKQLGFRIKLLGVADVVAGKVNISVQPTLVPIESPIAKISGVTNMAWLEAQFAGKIMLSGAGAGGAATASAVAGDIFQLANTQKTPTPIFAKPVAKFKPHKKIAASKQFSEFFLHMKVEDKSGMMAKISSCMAKQNISLESIMQLKESGKKNIKPLVLLTHKCTTVAMEKALADMKQKKCFKGKAQVLKIERIK